MNHATGVITTVAGNGTAGYSGDGGPATAAKLAYPSGVAVDAAGNLFIADTYNNRIREVNYATGVITTVAGIGALGYGGDGGPATVSELSHPSGAVVDAAGDLFIADAGNNRIREVVNGVPLTVNPAPLTITANNQSKVYGAVLPTLAVSYTGFVNGDTAASLTTQTTISTTATAASHVGTYSITASGAIDPDYAISYIGGTLSITPATLTITADSKSKVYAAAMPTLTYTVSGLIGSDTLATVPTLSTSATAASHVGTYAIMASGAVDADYSISYVGGSVLVLPATLTITADSKIKTYGAALPTLTYTVTGLVGSETLTTMPTLSTSATATSHVGSYAITVGGAAASSDYSIGYTNGTIFVTPAALTITADSKTKAYGAALPALTYTVTGLVGSDTLTTVPALSTSATAASHVGSYAITASGAMDADYTISYAAGTLSVTPVSLSITADSKTKAYGEALPALTASYSGFVNGDTAANLTAQPAITTAATAASHMGGVRHHCCRGGRCGLHDRLCGRHADRQPGSADDYGRQSGQGLWGSGAGLDRQL